MDALGDWLSGSPGMHACPAGAKGTGPTPAAGMRVSEQHSSIAHGEVLICVSLI